MTEPRRIYWSSRRLAKEYNMNKSQVGRLLKSLGAKRWNGLSRKHHGHTWYWEEG